jgi:hypothetical protein
MSEIPTGVLTTRSSPCTQIKQFCTALGSLFTSALERSESAFRRVHVMKKDENGNIKTYDRKEPANSGSSTTAKKVSVVTYIEDIKTGEMYLDEPGYVVAVKCFCIALGMPFYALGKVIWYAVKTPVQIAVIACDTIANTGEQLMLGRLYEAATHSKEGLIEAAQVLANGIFDIVKSPFLAIGCELAAIYGIFKPFHGRKFERIFENAWQNGVSFREDARKFPEPSEKFSWKDFKRDIHNANPFYLASCFQVRGNVKEPRVIVVRREPEYSLLTHLGNLLIAR